MSVEENIEELVKSLKNLEETGLYDVEKYSCSLLHQTIQLEYFYCHLVQNNDGQIDQTFYHVIRRPNEHQLAYYNIGRGFPKELMDGHWCYLLKDLGHKMLVIPCTSLKGTDCNPDFEKDIDIKMYGRITKSRIQLSDIRSVDIQRLDLRKPFCNVLTDRNEIIDFIKEKIF